MSVLLDRDTRIIVQGITGRRGQRVTEDMLSYGSQVLAGVSPGHAGQQVHGLPVFDFVEEAVAETQADAAFVLVPGTSAGFDAVLESAMCGVRLVVWAADPVPIQDMLRLKEALGGTATRLIGPNTPGIISPGLAKMGFMPSHCYLQGVAGVVSKSGSLSYEVCLRLSGSGIGQSTVLGVGGDPIRGTTVIEAVAILDDDPETEIIVLLGEIGGLDEYEVAHAVANGEITTPVVALVVGVTAKHEQKFGHAGALVLRNREEAAPKIAALRSAGISVSDSLSEIVSTVRLRLSKSRDTSRL